MLGNGCSDAGNIRFLEGVPSNECRCDLAADDDQGNGIHIGCGNTRNHIADARAGCGKANAGLARCPGVAISGVDGALFVARQDMRKFFFTLRRREKGQHRQDSRRRRLRLRASDRRVLLEHLLVSNSSPRRYADREKGRRCVWQGTPPVENRVQPGRISPFDRRRAARASCRAI